MSVPTHRVPPKLELQDRPLLRPVLPTRGFLQDRKIAQLQPTRWPVSGGLSTDVSGAAAQPLRRKAGSPTRPSTRWVQASGSVPERTGREVLSRRERRRIGPGRTAIRGSPQAGSWDHVQANPARPRGHTGPLMRTYQRQRGRRTQEQIRTEKLRKMMEHERRQLKTARL